MVRVGLDGGCGPRGLRIGLDGLDTRCAPCPPPATDPVVVEDITGRVIVRHRTETGRDDDGIAAYGWVTVYDGPGIWSPVRSTETGDAAGQSVEFSTVGVPSLEDPLETTASVWDHHRRKWTVVGTATTPGGGVTMAVERMVDADT